MVLLLSRVYIAGHFLSVLCQDFGKNASSSWGGPWGTTGEREPWSRTALCLYVHVMSISWVVVVDSVMMEFTQSSAKMIHVRAKMSKKGIVDTTDDTSVSSVPLSY